jgi:hypothetical protein
MAVVAVSGDYGILAYRKRRLKPDRNCLLTDVKMAKTPDKPKSIKLACFLLETADEQHLLVEFEHLVLRRLKADGDGRTFDIGESRARHVDGCGVRR